MAKGLVLSTGLVAAWIIVQVALVQLLRPRRPFLVITLAFLPTIPALILLDLATPRDLGFLPGALVSRSMVLELSNGAVVHLLLYATWMEGFFYANRSLTLGILVALMKAPGKTADLSAIRRVAGVEGVIDRRLEVLERNGYIRREGDRIFTTRRGRILAASVRIVRRALGVQHYLDRPSDPCAKPHRGE